MDVDTVCTAKDVKQQQTSTKKAAVTNVAKASMARPVQKMARNTEGILWIERDISSKQNTHKHTQTRCHVIKYIHTYST